MTPLRAGIIWVYAEIGTSIKLYQNIKYGGESPYEGLTALMFDLNNYDFGVLHINKSITPE